MAAALLLATGWAHAQVSATRSLSTEFAIPGQAINVTLRFRVDSPNPPATVILVENFPPGWTIVNVSPPAANVDTANGEISWLIGENPAPDINLPVANSQFTYTLLPPGNIINTVYPLDGRMDFLVSGEPVSIFTGGQLFVTAPELPLVPIGTAVLAGLILLLGLRRLPTRGSIAR